MTQKEITSKLQAGEPIKIVRAVTKRIGNLAIQVKIKYYVGEKIIPRALFESVRSKNKLVLDIDKSSPAITVFKLSTL
jgi:hypothetical protein